MIDRFLQNTVVGLICICFVPYNSLEEYVAQQRYCTALADIKWVYVVTE
jgi:hypothetical protein